jgi:hypothetical protein
MARSSSQGGGLAVLFLFALPFIWLHDKCSGGSERRERERAAQEVRDRAERERWAAEAEASRVEKELEARRKAQALAQQRATAVAALAAMKPWQRASAVTRCSNDSSECPGGASDPALIFEAAKTPAERKQLEAAHARLERARERANAPLLCCDGTESPSCTCNGPRRGCCSHHKGVCGCSAD